MTKMSFLSLCEAALGASILNVVARRIFQVAVSFILLLATLTPLLELCDHWDKGVVPATDTELRVTATFACAGLLLTVATLMRWSPAFVASTKRSLETTILPLPTGIAALEPAEPTGSPPLLPLRI